MIVLNSLVFDKDYSKLTDKMHIEYLKTVEEFGLSPSFYGGAIDKIAKLKGADIYLLIDSQTNGLQIRDVAVDNIDKYSFKVLSEFATIKGIDFKPVGTSKEVLIDEIKKRTLVLN